MYHHNFSRSLREEFNELVNAFLTLKFWKTVSIMLIGIMLFSIGFNGILLPHGFFAGGISGICLMIYYVTSWPSVGVIYLLVSIPVFIFGWREVSLNFIVISLIGTLFFTFSLEITSGIVLPAHDEIISAILAGIIMGFGTGLYLRIGGTAGGSDIIAAIFKRRLSIPMGNTFLIINIMPIVGAAIIYDLDTALYSGICMYVYSFVIEKVQTGFSQRKSVFIISSKPELIAENVMKRLDRGITYFHSSGGWSGTESKVIYTVINMKELGRLKQMIYETDPDCFIAVNNTAEVIGGRFLSWEDEGFKPKPIKAF